MAHTRWHSGVKPFVEFCCRTGNLGYAETPAARAEQGQMAQRRVQAAPPPGYRKEVAVEDTFHHSGITLTLSGRIDGLWEQEAELYLEEIKSTYFHDDTLPDAVFQVHQAQALCYAAMLPDAQRYASVRIRITYFQLKDEVCFYREHTISLTDITARYQRWAEEYCLWLAKIARHRQQRDAWAHGLEFPFAHYRRGQRALAVTAWRYARDHKVAMLEAPTGAGKTISLLFPALKRFADDPSMRLFYTTAKNSGQRTVQQTLQRLPGHDAILGVFLGAKSNLCPCLATGQANDLAIDLTNESSDDATTSQCSRCMGYYDRRRAAFEKALDYRHIDAHHLQALSDEFQVCPHQLALELCEWADMVTGDFNYLFDPFTRQALDNAFDEHSLILVDEAHNLPERARGMYSATVTVRELELLLPLKPPGPVRKHLNALIRHCKSPPMASVTDATAGATVPTAFFHTMKSALQSVLESLREWMDAQPALAEDRRFDVWITLFALQRAFEHWGDHYCLMLAESDQPPQITAYCLDPGFFLADIWQQSASALIFSGTLQPQEWFAQSLGLQRLPADRRGEDVSIEHALENTEVRAALLALPMQYTARQQSLPVAIPYIAELLNHCPGRYLVAAASFDMLGQLREALAPAVARYEWFLQAGESRDADRQAFLAGFVASERSVALVISGGVFAEGIDLADTPLQGVIQVGLPIPPPSEERKRLQTYYQSHQHSGFDYAFNYPAIARTLQTCGRLLRKDGDKGVLLLIDARFLRPPFAGFLPTHWQTRRVRSPSELIAFAT